MPIPFKTVLAVYFCVSVVGALMVALDKYNAKNKLYRISEATLFFFGFCGGALVMFAFMKLCRHKTKKQKFMVGFPLIAVLNIVVLFLCYK